MKVRIYSKGDGPDHYTIDGEIIIANKGGQSESFDLSVLEQGDKFQGVEPNTLDFPGQHIVRDAYRDTEGELHVTLCQAVGPGNWSESAEFDASEYDPDAIQVPFLGESAGNAWALTQRGKMNPNTNEVIDGTG